MSHTSLSFYVHADQSAVSPPVEILGGVTVSTTFVPARYLIGGVSAWTVSAFLHCDDAPSLRALAARLIEVAEAIEASAAAAEAA